MRIMCILIAIVCTKEISDQTQRENQIHVTTPGHYLMMSLSEYCIQPSAQQTLKFEVKASADAIIDLNTNVAGTFYQIVIGGNANRVCMVRRYDAWKFISKEYKYIDKLLDENEYRQFWIKWIGGYILAGRGHDPNQLLTVFCQWHDPNPLSVTSLGLASVREAEFIIYDTKNSTAQYTKFPGQLATNEILARDTMTSKIKCAVTCSSHTRCTSFNFKKSTNLCELVQMRKSDIKPDTEYDLFSMC